MKDEMTSISQNKVWSLVELPYSYRPIGCKWVFKTRRDAKEQVERYKERLVAKGYNQREGIDFKETFSLVSIKDSLRIIMVMVVHFDIELHQMDMMTTFLNGDLDKNVYMSQSIGFEEVGKKHMVCKLKKSIYGLNKASRQWDLKFDEVAIMIGFKENIVDQCIYMKVSGRKYIFLVLYVDNILLATNDTGLLVETKKLLFSHFDMKDPGEASYVLGIQILCDIPSGIMTFSQ